MKSTNLIRCLICLLLIAMMVGCGGGKRGKKIDYDSAKTLPPLEIPPDLSSLPPDAQSSGTALPPGSATYSKFEEEQTERGTGPQVAGLLPQFENVRLARAGAARWLVVTAPAEKVWPQLPVFLDKMGLRIKRERPDTGIIETDWAENRAKVASPIERFFSKITGQGLGTMLRDKYRIRLERGEQPGTTEIYLTHRGMEQFFVDQIANPAPTGEQYQKGRWKTRPSDPELEAEMLRLLMVHLGVARPKADTIVAKVKDAPERARLSRNEKGYSALNLSDSLERAWRRVGLSLDRIGFTVEDRDRTTWTYHVRYIDPEAETTKKKKKKKKKGTSNSAEYQVALKAVDYGTTVEVLNNNGVPDASNTSERILSLLYEQLK